MNQTPNEPDRPPLADVLRQHTPSLLAISGVVGTGEGRSDGQPVFVVIVVRRTADLEGLSRGTA